MGDKRTDKVSIAPEDVSPENTIPTEPSADPVVNVARAIARTMRETNHMVRAREVIAAYDSALSAEVERLKVERVHLAEFAWKHIGEDLMAMTPQEAVDAFDKSRAALGE